ncbi:Pyruvate phosphate dikinase,PEP/pyruvate-binding [Ostreococcus tauri]|uniref:Pyruvate phosphate dikinase,PEP/pyruvate-binding n=1 Tax=Ostreococcus tauri TaxID=70448 RepID=A0A096P7D7_OSTTA|nr:Pyruvate phosphate dikinase,PEP/pyruvate-binding [Ostreococcus tauri]CEG00106.1 Pyruvate phosphate dikinase,PEP/pyruvate-binding [Ostreococcus tauri]|eukprot:XP_022840203.1 Pyruvate phosphate dikinase,PEP/pyruvate-binding [Ostreococcus tauri]
MDPHWLATSEHATTKNPPVASASPPSSVCTSTRAIATTASERAMSRTTRARVIVPRARRARDDRAVDGRRRPHAWTPTVRGGRRTTGGCGSARSVVVPRASADEIVDASVIPVGSRGGGGVDASGTRTRKMELRARGADGAAVDARATTNARGVHTVSVSMKTLPRGVVSARDVTFHWGVVREATGATWQMLPRELLPPNTEYHGEKAMRSAFPVWGPINLVLDPLARKVAFVLHVEKTGEWINAADGGNFEIQLDAADSETPRAVAPAVSKAPARAVFQTKTPIEVEVQSPPNDPLERLIAATAHAEWEKMGRPALASRKRDDMLKNAAEQIKAKLSSGMSLESISREIDGIKTSISPTRVEVQPKETLKTPSKSMTKVNTRTNFTLADFQAAANARAADNTVVKWNKLYEGNDETIYVEARELVGGSIQLNVVAESKDDLILHWAVTKVTDGTWQPPPNGFSTTPARSWASSGVSWETEFERMDGHLRGVTLDVPVNSGAREGVIFVLRTTSNRWIKNGKEDFFASLEGSVLERPQKNEKSQSKKRRDVREEKRREERPAKPTVAAKEKKRTAPIKRQHWDADDIAIDQGAFQNLGGFVADNMVNKICDAESGATRSLMHRYNAGADMLGDMHGNGEPGLTALFCWFRFMALRQLVWNNDYNIKPREISAAQNRMTEGLSTIYRQNGEHRDVVRLIMATIGRGGSGDVGQRIRDEILAVQQKNNCKGGMMEEWHQKLHNNTSPDDVPICEALLKFIAADCDINVYWAHLHANGITAERMASYDRKICSEPKFSREQYAGLTADLTEYLRTLKAVHSGADLDSAAEACLGYHQDACKGKEINIPPIHGVASDRLEELLDAARELRSEDPLCALEAMIEARRYLWTWTRPNGKSNDRIKDVIYLDLALEGAARAVVESCLESLPKRAPYEVLRIMSLVLENLCMSTSGNYELRICLKEWQNVLEAARRNGEWALQGKAVCDRLQNSLAEISQRYIDALQPTAHSMGAKLGVDGHVLDIFSEEVIRGTAAAPLSQMLRVIDPIIRNVAEMGSWQIVSNAECAGVIVPVRSLAEVQHVKYSQPTVLISDRVGGEEDIPVGVVAIITPDMPDILSHCAVRARNEKVLFATAFDVSMFEHMKGMDGKSVELKPSAQGDDLQVQVVDRVEASSLESSSPSNASAVSGVSIIKRPFQGKFVATSSEFTPELVGGKSRNLQLLRGRVSNLIKLPPSVAMPFGTFDAVLDMPQNAEAKTELTALVAQLETYDYTDGAGFRELIAKVKACIRTLQPNAELSATLETAFLAESLSWPGDLLTSAKGQKAWQTILGVWASKYNERAVLSCRKASLNHADLSMAVLCQPVVRARYAFVLHTVNPQNNNKDEIYGELVCGLGETLVGNFSGRALSFKASKNDLDNPTVVGFPSKSKALFMEEDTLIFRSDSNGEDLEGFAGAGLYDSITMEEATLRNVDYSADYLMTDESKRRTMLSMVAKIALEIENLCGSPQDIEGAIADNGSIYIVQTRPQV